LKGRSNTGTRPGRLFEPAEGGSGVTLRAPTGRSGTAGWRGRKQQMSRSELTYVPLKNWICARCGAAGDIEVPEQDPPSCLDHTLTLAHAHKQINPSCAYQWGVGYLRVRGPEEEGWFLAIPDVDPQTGIAPIERWRGSCGRGFVSDSRFGSGLVLKRNTHRSKRK